MIISLEQQRSLRQLGNLLNSLRPFGLRLSQPGNHIVKGAAARRKRPLSKTDIPATASCWKWTTKDTVLKGKVGKDNDDDDSDVITTAIAPAAKEGEKAYTYMLTKHLLFWYRRHTQRSLNMPRLYRRLKQEYTYPFISSIHHCACSRLQ